MGVGTHVPAELQRWQCPRGLEQPALAQQQLWPSQGSRGRMLEHPSLQLSDVTLWGWWQQLPWESSALAAVESLVKRKVTCTAGKRNRRWQGLHAELRTIKPCAAKERNLKMTLRGALGGDSHRKEVWKPLDLWQSFPGCLNLLQCYYILHIQKS